MNVEQIYTGCLSQGAYYIESQGEAAIIDPLREVNLTLKKPKKTKPLSSIYLKHIFMQIL